MCFQKHFWVIMYFLLFVWTYIFDIHLLVTLQFMSHSMFLSNGVHSRHVLCLVVATIKSNFFKMKWFITSRFLKDGTAIQKLFNRELQWKAFTSIFQLLCILLALILAYLCYGDFMRNEDFCVVSFKKMYNEDENVHPSLTICFTSPFDEMKIKSTESNKMSYCNSAWWPLTI